MFRRGFLKSFGAVLASVLLPKSSKAVFPTPQEVKRDGKWRVFQPKDNAWREIPWREIKAGDTLVAVGVDMAGYEPGSGILQVELWKIHTISGSGDGLIVKAEYPLFMEAVIVTENNNRGEADASQEAK